MPSKKKELTIEEQQFLLKIGFRIGYFRKLRGISQQELADKAGISLNSVSHIESTAVTGISLITMYRLADTLGINPKQLLDFDEQKKQPFISSLAQL